MIKYLLGILIAATAWADTNVVTYETFTPVVPGQNLYPPASCSNYYAACGGTLPTTATEIYRLQEYSIVSNGTHLLRYQNALVPVPNPDYPRYLAGQMAARNYDPANGDFNVAIDALNGLLHQTNDVEVLSGYHQDWKNIIRAQQIGTMPPPTLTQTNPVYSAIPSPTGATKDGVLIDIGNIAKAWAIGSEPQPNTQPVVTPISAPLVTQ